MARRLQIAVSFVFVGNKEHTMPKKPNSHGNDQEYVPAGNGDASGEYADEKGSNWHFENFTPYNDATGSGKLLKGLFDNYIAEKGVEIKGKNGIIKLGENPNKKPKISKKTEQQNKEFEEKFSQERKDKAVWCKSKEESEKVYTQWKQVWANATVEEQDGLENYTKSSGHMNRPLRGYDQYWGSNYYKGIGNVSLNNESPFGAKRIDGLTSLIDKSVSEFDCWVQRGVNFDGAKQFLGINGNITQEKLDAIINENRTLKDAGFFSCGAAKGTGFSGDVVLNVYCPKGTKMFFAGKTSWYKGTIENEMILQRGSEFRATKATKSGSKWYIDVEITGQDYSQYKYNK